MPIYEYRCLKCHEIFEVLQKASDPAPKSHRCGGRRVERVMSRTSFVLKGTGWYITDYGRKDKGGGGGKSGDNGDSKGSSSKSGGDSSKGSGTKSDSKSDSKNDSKSDTKADTKPAATSGAT
ncbi:MAG: zinc ribbon domain-containing protein [Deltaproteobacteria bacterium]|nr:zinc ribbon domain-containing protein [Deltaproteobacteria bacterium]